MRYKSTILIVLILSTLFLLTALLPTETYAATITRTQQFEITAEGNDADVYGQNAVYATARTTASGTESGDWLSVGQDYTGGQYKVYRGFLKFDTSSIPNTATILSAKLCLYGEWNQSVTDFIIRLQNWTDDTPIDTGDYNEFDGNNYDDGNFNTASFVETEWNNITITTFTLINITGTTNICLRSSRDINADTPTGAEFVQFYTYDWLGDKPAFLEISYSFPAPQYTTIPKWMVGGENGTLIATDLEQTDDLTDALGSFFDVKTMKNGFGFYLLGLEDEPLGTYQSPGAGARIVKYDGNTFTNVAPSVQGVQIMDIARYVSKFLIGGYYESTGESYEYGRLYTYDGQTFVDVTTQILGSNFGPAVVCLADCEGYWLIGTYNSTQAFGYIFKWDGQTLTEIMNVYEELGTGVYSTDIVWNGEYALIGFSYGSYYGPIYKYNGTFTDLSSQADFLAMSGITDIAWNGTHFLIAGGYENAGYEYSLKCYNQTTFTTIENWTRWNTIEWNGDYWMLGGRNQTANRLVKFDGESTWTDYSSLIWYEPTTLCPGALMVYVTSEPELNARFEFQGKAYTTPVIVVCYSGSYFVSVEDLFRNINDTTLAFTHMIYSASPPIEIYSSTTTLPVSNDGNLTLVYFTGFRRPHEVEVTPPPEELMKPCFPMTFYIILVVIFLLGIYLYSRRELWKVSVLLLPVIGWMLLLMPCPPWDLYIAIAFTIIVVALLLNKGRRH